MMLTTMTTRCDSRPTLSSPYVPIRPASALPPRAAPNPSRIGRAIDTSPSSTLPFSFPTTAARLPKQRHVPPHDHPRRFDYRRTFEAGRWAGESGSGGSSTVTCTMGLPMTASGSCMGEGVLAPRSWVRDLRMRNMHRRCRCPRDGRTYGWVSCEYVNACLRCPVDGRRRAGLKGILMSMFFRRFLASGNNLRLEPRRWCGAVEFCPWEEVAEPKRRNTGCVAGGSSSSEGSSAETCSIASMASESPDHPHRTWPVPSSSTVPTPSRTSPSPPPSNPGRISW
ncbi:hypothetical protein OF83DRAFT_151170 [Amylostereum chailletii]|nr:hypothetical protein OF83DRAFT_151170 [Amylostereum chailletii]